MHNEDVYGDRNEHETMQVDDYVRSERIHVTCDVFIANIGNISIRMCVTA
jgi:hypothetical protein